MAEHYGLHEPLVQRAYYAGPWKLVRREDGFTELYELRADPFELRNLAAAPGYSAVLGRLQRGLYQAMTATGDTGTALWG